MVDGVDNSAIGILLTIVLLFGLLIYFTVRNQRRDISRINRKLAKERLKRIKKCRKKQL